MSARLPVFFGGILLGGGLIYAGGWPFRIFLIVAAACLTFEIFRAFRSAPQPHPALHVFIQAYALLGVLAFGAARESGWIWPAAAFLAAVVTDTVAYLAGRAWGRTPLAPTISPSKTVEGAMVGLVAGAASVAGFLCAFDLTSFEGGALLGMGLSALSILGDLIESSVKRRLGIKDFGTILPGHGGIFDRIDSLILSSIGLFAFLSLALG